MDFGLLGALVAQSLGHLRHESSNTFLRSLEYGGFNDLDLRIHQALLPVETTLSIPTMDVDKLELSKRAINASIATRERSQRRPLPGECFYGLRMDIPGRDELFTLITKLTPDGFVLRNRAPPPIFLYALVGLAVGSRGRYIPPERWEELEYQRVITIAFLLDSPLQNPRQSAQQVIPRTMRAPQINPRQPAPLPPGWTGPAAFRPFWMPHNGEASAISTSAEESDSDVDAKRDSDIAVKERDVDVADVKERDFESEQGYDIVKAEEASVVVVICPPNLN